MNEYMFSVEMSCSGCSNAVNRALLRLEGVEEENIDINLDKQTVYVKTDLPREKVLETIKKTGKTVKDE
ncbi:hypothetical protein BDB00DRAFT_823860 [Zychaea mexicana]|uniref:uncharacterized protein n=1 Tax=Zychaea mexicana TaxID=64656 RepID=UPI0022FE2FC3|nr:uncharacterized protein BDB00DRAFT_823860 [Zychaea mexicana]KAI9493391.1 hypothetical protein BDB00DRAFT_823860 [Zychaea mexicana]